MKLDLRAILQSLTVALLLAVLGAAVKTYIQVELLRVEVDRLNVYVEQLWEESRKR